jgi:TolB-like protein/DNA-binding winged helix-turn-helix (wHTH) protein
MTNRENTYKSNRYHFDGFSLDAAKRELKQGDSVISVEKKVMDLLYYLVEHRDRVVDKDELQDAVWPGTVVTEAALSRGIMKARRAVNDSAEDSRFIKTFHGQGYRFIADVNTRSGADDHPSSDDRVQISRTAAILFGLGFLLLLSVVVAVLNPIIDKVESASTVAVLTFDNLSPDPEHDYFATGIQEEILNELAHRTDLLVMARASVVAYDNSAASVKEIAAELGVDNIVKGSVRYADNSVRISVQLVAARTGVQLWSNVYDRQFSEIFQIQSDIARRVAEALEAEILGTERILEPQSVEAYQEYLLASSLRYRTFEIGWEPVLEHTRKSLEYDASFIPSLSLLHNAYQNRIVGENHTAANKQMQAITAKAISRDPNHPISLSLQAKDAAYQWQWKESQRYWRKALEADPTDPDNLGTAAMVSIGAGDYMRAEQILENGIRSNPRHDWPLYGRMLLNIARNDQMDFISTGDLIISMGGNRAFPAAVHLAMYFAVQAEPEMVSRYGKTIHSMTAGTLDSYIQSLVDFANGRKISGELITEILQANPPPNTYKWMVVQLYVLNGNLDKAFEMIDDIVASKALFSVLRIVSDPAFDRLKNDPRYKIFLREVGLEDRIVK